MSPSYHLKKSVSAMAIPVLAAAAPLFAGDPDKAIIDDKAPVASGWSVCDFFDHTTLYEGDGFVKSLKFTGRYHGGYLDTVDDYTGGGEADFWEHRRFRAGVVAKLGENLTFQNIYNLDTTPDFNADQFVTNVDELFIKWEPTDDVYLTVGKQKQLILREYEVSSNKLNVYERSLITTNTISQKLWGAALGFKGLGLDHELGVWGVAFEDDFAWPSFENAGASFTYRSRFDLNDATSLHFDYQYVDQSRDAAFSETFAGSPYENVVALGSESQWGNFGLITDVIAAFDRQDGRLSPGDDSQGFLITPYYNVTENLQLVARYAYASDGRVGRPQRYASSPDVDGHNAVYLGLQYFICGDKLKLQVGHEWAQADRIVGTTTEYENNTWMAGVRLSW